MSRMTWAPGVVAVAMALAPSASATPSAGALARAPAPAPVSPPDSASTSSAAASSPASVGLAVVAMPGAADAAWPLARAVYADASLRAADIDEAHARVLCGEPAATRDPAELRDLSDTVAALRGEDAPSRALLGGIARRFSTRGLVVVAITSDHPTARVFLTETGAFDAATYAPDDSPALAWSATTRSLARTFGQSAAPALATHDGPNKAREERASSRPFYESTWFWGAIGAAALTGGVVYFATRDSSPKAIHLEVEVPH